MSTAQLLKSLKHWSLAVAVTVAPFAGGSHAEASAQKSFQDLSAGPPAYVTEGLLPSSRYIPFEVRKLKAPKLAWVNYELLREMGYNIGPKLTPEQEADLLDALAWVVADRFADPKIMTNEKRTMWADFYGGWGIGANKGSARAGVLGKVQSKGSGITPHLVGYDAKHTARSSAHESVKDAVWGDFTHSELPADGNRLIAIIDRGSGALENGEPQMIEIRQDPLRAGHYVTREWGSDADDKTHSAEAAALLDHALPQPATLSSQQFEKMSKAEKIASGLMEYADRVGRQYGAQHMLRIYHGATSQSNIEIDGRAIDFGTASAQPDYSGIFFLQHVAPFGPLTTAEVSSRLIGDTTSAMLRLLPAAERNAVNDLILKSAASTGSVDGTLKRVFATAFEREAARQALSLTGVPMALAEELRDTNMDFARQLIALTMYKSAPKIDLQNVATLTNIPESALARANRAVSALSDWSPASITAALTPILTAGDLSGLANNWSQFLTSARAKAMADGVGAPAFGELVRLNASWKNRELRDLYLPDLRKTTQAANDAYLAGQTDALGETIEKVLTNTQLTIKELGRYESPIAVKRNRAAGEIDITAFNAQTGRFERLIRSRVLPGARVSIGGQLMSKKDLEGLTAQNETRQLSVLPRVEAQGKFVKVTIPLESATDVTTIGAAKAERARAVRPSSRICKSVLAG